MNESERKAQLIVQHGSQKGKKFELKKQIIVIGSDSSSDIRISGEFVSPKHAQFQLRDDGIWMIRNESINGTLVNQKNIDIKPLQNKDVIQIGSQTLLRFEQVESKKAKKSRIKIAAAKSGKKGKTSSTKQMAIAVGLTVYLGIMGLVLVPSGDEQATEAEKIYKAEIEQKVSKQELLNCLVKTIDTGSSSIYVADKNDLASEYHLIRSKAAQEDNEEEIEQILESIIVKANRYFFNAWVYEQQKDWNAAIRSYQQIERLIPDIRCPSTVFVQNKIKQLNNDRDQ